MTTPQCVHDVKGLWVATDDELPKRLKRPHIAKVLSALRAKGNDGLSNAEIDSLLSTASQWLIFWDLRELIALEIIRYEVHPFGEPGKYVLTEKGLTLSKDA